MVNDMRKRIIKTRILSGILANVMIFTVLACVPFSGYAEETEKKVLMAAAYDAKGGDQMNSLTPAEWAADGNRETFWNVFSEAVRGYIVIDLCSEQRINTIKLTDPDAVIADYTYEYSEDASEWQELCIGAYPERSEKTDTFPNVRARYIKLNINSCTTGTGGFRIGEIEAFYDKSVSKKPNADVNKIYKDVLPTEADGKAIELLSALGIVNGDADGYFRPNSQLTRGEFAKIVANIFSEDMRIISDYPFVDVGDDVSLKGAVSIVYGYGLMLGKGDGYFRPEEPITGAEAVKTLVALAGYTSMAEARGGYFNGYHSVAMENGILKNLNINFAKPITRRQAALMTANALEVKPLDIIGVKDGSNVYSKNANTLLESYAGIYKERGIVTANKFTALYSESSAKDGMVRITADDVEESYVVYDSAVYDYLGYHVEFYYSIDKSSEDKELLYLREYNTVTQKIEPSDIQSYADGTLTYYDNNERSDDVYIQPTAPIIKNGVYLGRLAHTMTVQGDLSMPSGMLKLIDNDHDKKVDIVIIYSYVNGLIDSISKSKNKIFLKGNQSIEFNFSDDRNRIIKDGKEITSEELNNFDCVSVAVSDNGDVTTVYVSTSASISGVLDTVDKESVYIDGQEYELGGRIDLNGRIYGVQDFLKKLTLGTDITVYFNIDNKVVALYGGKTEDQYGYLMNALYDDNMSQLWLRIFTQNGKVVRLEGDERIRISGKKEYAKDVYQMLLNGSSVRRQVIRYKVNAEDKISKLTLPDLEAGKNNEAFEGDDSLIPYGSPYQFSNQRFYWGKGLGNADTGVKEFVLDDSTLVFQIPGDNNEKNYRVLTKSIFSNSESYDVMPYNVDRGGKAAFVAVDMSSSSAIDAYSQVYLVTKVIDTIDEDNEPVKELKLVSKGSESTIRCNAETDITRFKVGQNGKVLENVNYDLETLNLSAIKAGSLIQYSSGDPVKTVRLFYPLSVNDTKPKEGWRYSYGWGAEKVFGKAVSITNSNITLNTGAMTCYYPLDSTIKIHLWEQTCKSSEIIGLSDILTTDKVGETKADYFFYMPGTKSMFVFRF